MFMHVGSSTTLVLPMSMRYPGVGMTGHSQSDLKEAARDIIASSIFPIGGLGAGLDGVAWESQK